MNYVNDFWSWEGVSSTEYSESGMQNGEHVYEMGRWLCVRMGKQAFILCC